MRAVSGTSGAAPVWRDVMLALHAGRPGQRAGEPRGDRGAADRFRRRHRAAAPRIFPRGHRAGRDRRRARPPRAGRASPIPVSGSVYALDPDIPIDRQRLAIGVTGEGDAPAAARPARSGCAERAPLVLPGRAGTGSRWSISAGGRRSGRVHGALRIRSAIASAMLPPVPPLRRDAQTHRRPGGHCNRPGASHYRELTSRSCGSRGSRCRGAYRPAARRYNAAPSAG